MKKRKNHFLLYEKSMRWRRFLFLLSWKSRIGDAHWIRAGNGLLDEAGYPAIGPLGFVKREYNLFLQSINVLGGISKEYLMS